jgi:hypothetical protein
MNIEQQLSTVSAVIKQAWTTNLNISENIQCNLKSALS